MTKILGFDTANNSCSVAISDGDNILAYCEERRPSMQAERLLSMIEQVLKDADIKYQELDYLAVTNGPGSFTGIRIGLAAAKGIMLGCNVKGLAITNFEMMLYRAKQQVTDYDKIVILLNAYRNQLYYQEFSRNGKGLKPKLIDNQNINEILTNINGKIICTGNGVSVVYDDIKDIPDLTILPRFATIKAIHVCRLASLKIKQNILSPIKPLYIRPPDAKLPKTMK